MTHVVVYEDDTIAEVEADHFRFESSYLTLTQWRLVLLRPREVVVRRIPLGGPQPVRGVLTDQVAVADLGSQASHRW